MIAHLPDDVLNTPAYWLMKWSLENSNVYDSIKWRLGTALLAQQKVSQFISRPLRDNHWETEARQLFETSLARIQFDAWGIARGEDRKQSGYVEVTPDEGKGKLCHLYKFNSTGHTNVNLGAFIGLLLAPFMILFLSLEERTVKRFFLRCFCCRPKMSNDNETGNAPWEPLVVNRLLIYLATSVLLIPKGLRLCAAWLYKGFIRIPHP